MESKLNIQKNIIITRSNPVNPDSRVEKEALALSEADYNVSILCWDRRLDSPKKETRTFGNINRFKLKAPYGSLMLFPLIILWWIYEFFWLLIHEFDCIHACDFDTVVPAFFVAKIKRKKIIYDVFDYYADILPFKKTSIFYKILTRIDTFFINNCDAVILVDEARLKQIDPAIPKKIEFIYNSPMEQLHSYDCIDTRNTSSDFTLFYAGILPSNRGLDTAIDVAEKINDFKFILAGFGEKEEYFRNKCAKSKNVEFLGKISYKKVIDLEKKSSALIATYDPAVRNHRYSSANKLFEAMMLGKPIIVAEDTGMDTIVLNENMGVVVSYENTNDLICAIEKLKNDKNLYEVLSKNSRQAYKKYSWTEMKQRLLKLYTELI